MAVDTKHPDLLAVQADYQITKDTFDGERTVKTAGFAYLPATAGQLADGAGTNVASAGFRAYTTYRTRAQFPEFVSEAVDLLVSVMHQEPPVIKLPKALEPIRKRATRDGLGLNMLLRRINEHQLRFGRIGLLADFPQEPFFSEAAQTPHIVEYEADTILNWDNERITDFSLSQLSFVALNETTNVRGEDFSWSEERRFRIAQLAPEAAELPVSASNPLVYSTWTQTEEAHSDLITPAFRGVTLDRIPFVFIGSNDLDPSPNQIPLLGLANLSLSIYKKSADLEQVLHMLGQDTLVIKGPEITKDGQAKDESDDTRVGASAIIRVEEEGDAKFIGISGQGVEEMRQSITADKGRAQSMGPRLLESRMGQAESGEALRARISSQTATLQTLALTGAAGLEEILRVCAVWIGADPEEVSVEPNVDFTQDMVDTSQLKAMAEATGRPIRLGDRTIHTWMQNKNFTRESFEDEQELMTNETVPAPKPPEPSPPQDDPEGDSMENEEDGDQISS